MSYKALDLVDRSGTVTAKWYMLEESERWAGEFGAPNVVPVLPVDGAEQQRIWPPPPRAAPRFPPRPRRAGDGPGDGDHDAREDPPDPLLEQDGEEEPWEALGEEEVAIAEAELLSEELLQLSEAPPVASEPDAAPDATASSAPVQSSPQEAMVAAPAPPEPAGDGIAGAAARRGAAVTLQCPGGSISYYPSKQAFEAVCQCRDHGRCVLTRTRRGKQRRAGAPVEGGRPVGFLAAWLAAGEGLSSKDEHWAPSVLARPLGERADFRRQIAESGEAGRTLLGFERPCEAGEPAEPEGLAGYLRG